jgi:hypothetical protein
MFERRKLHLINPATGERKWYLPTSPMVLFFAAFLFPFVTRKLWGWLTVWIIYDLIAIIVAVSEDQMSPHDALATDRVFQFIVLGLSFWACLVANKQATRKLLAQGWLVSTDTLDEAWKHFQMKWKLPESAKQDPSSVPAATPPRSPAPLATGMVFCRGCGHRIHETAPTCPQCGAPQLMAQSPSASS